MSWPGNPSCATPRRVARGGERRRDDRAGEPTPGGGQHCGVVADHIDYRADDLARLGADRSECDRRVGDDLVDLDVNVSGANQCAGDIERALPRQEGGSTGLDDRDVVVARWRVQLIGVDTSDPRSHAAKPAPAADRCASGFDVRRPLIGRRAR